MSFLPSPGNEQNPTASGGTASQKLMDTQQLEIWGRWERGAGRPGRQGGGEHGKRPVRLLSNKNKQEIAICPQSVVA